MTRTIQWLNANAYRNYPFVEDAKLDLSGGYTLDKGVLLDFRCVSYVHSQRAIRLKQIAVYAPPSGPKVASFSFVFDNAVTYGTIILYVPENGVIPYASTAHIPEAYHTTCLFGPGMAQIFALPPGTYSLLESPQIEPALIGYQPAHRVLSIRAEGPLETTVLSGDIHVREGYNCQVTVRPETDTVRISAIKGAGQGISCEKVDEGVLSCTDALLHLNGRRAGDSGEFILRGAFGVELFADPENHTIVISIPPAKQDIECG